MSNASSRLFEPTRVGDIKLNHRVVLCPLTRLRATDKHVIMPELASIYYSQRGCVPGTLLISEGTLIHRKAGGRFNAPVLETEEQIAAWKKVGCTRASASMTDTNSCISHVFLRLPMRFMRRSHSSSTNYGPLAEQWNTKHFRRRSWIMLPLQPSPLMASLHLVH